MTSVATSKTLLLTLLMAGLSLAGCMGGGDVEPQQTQAPGGPATFTEDTGAITGLVTNDEGLPLAGAVVALVGDDEIATTTSDAGAFSLSNIEPGTYTLAAQKLGYESAAQSVDVAAGQETSVEFQLVPIAVAEPYAENLPHSGQYGTGVAVVRTTYCLDGCGAADGNEGGTWFMFGGLPDDFAGLVVEAQWETADSLAFDFLSRSSTCGEDGETSCMWYRTRGESPLHFYVEPCGDYIGEPYYGRSAVPCDPETFEDYRGTGASAAHLETWYAGQFQEEAHTLDPVCHETIPGVVNGYEAGCYGAGLAPETRWETWVTIFHMEAPPDAERYTAFPDA